MLLPRAKNLKITTFDKAFNEGVDCILICASAVQSISKLIAKIMKKKYFFPPLPPIFMKIAIGWELGESLGLTSMRIIPEKLLKENFEFEAQTLEMCEKEFIE